MRCRRPTWGRLPVAGEAPFGNEISELFDILRSQQRCSFLCLQACWILLEKSFFFSQGEKVQGSSGVTPAQSAAQQ